jgi:hypothetical protein
LTQIFRGDLMVLWAIRQTTNIPLTTSSSTLVLITTHPTSMPFFPHGCISLCDQDNIHAELVFLRNIFRPNGYSDRQIHRFLNPLAKVALLSKKPESVMFLPYIGSFFTCINRMLSQHNIKSAGLLLRKLSGFLQSVKDNLQLKKPAVYSIPCECGQVYIGKTGHLTDTSRLVSTWALHSAT